MKNAYLAMKERHQKRVNDLPIKFAFSRQQFREAMESLGLTEDDTDKVYKLGSTGGIYRRTDSKLIFDTFEQNDREMQDAIAADTDGTGFIRDMFRYELDNHEYSYTRDLEPTLDALGYTEDDVLNNPSLLNGLKLAILDCILNAQDY